MTEIEVLQSFRRNANGSWTALKPFSIGGVSAGPGISFSRGVAFSGLDLAALLDQLAAKYPWAVQN
jgi:hypothetical protein